MLLGFKTQLKLNNKQQTTLAQHAGCARHAWNWGLALTKQILDHNQTLPEREKIKFPTAIDLHKWLVALVKPENPWYYQSSKCAPQYALRALREAWGKCFTKEKGAPKFKKKGKKDSFTLDGTVKAVGNSQIQVPVIGILRTYEKLPVPIGFTPKSVTISRQADRWFISWKIEVPPQPTIKQVDVVGVDLGVKNLATLSTGEVFEGAKSYRKFEKKLGRLQRQQRNKTIDSKNWIKSQLKVARLHRRIANVRQDTLHKLTTYLAKNHGTLVIEDLNVSGMIANHKLAKAISDMGFYEFQRQLDYKTPLYGSKLVLADRWYPSSKTCFNCGSLKKSLSLKERTYRCECGWECDRDLNAAYNLVRLVQSEFTPVDSAQTPRRRKSQGNAEQDKIPADGLGRSRKKP